MVEAACAPLFAPLALLTLLRLPQVCSLKSVYKEELDTLPLGIGGRIRTLDETTQGLLNAPKPPLEYTPPVKEKKVCFLSFMPLHVSSFCGKVF